MNSATHTEHGDGEIARANEILRTEVGSGLHGIAIEGTDDHDEMGVFIEPPDHVIGVRPAVEHYVWRTQPEGHRSGHGDTDLVLYSLRKYLRLAIAGNPTMLLPLYAPMASVYACTGLGEELRALAPAILSRQSARKFVGYLGGQVEMMLGRGRQKDLPKRPELVAAHGYDTKFASHALRLGFQGLEVTEHARLTLPMPAPERDRVRLVKSGGVPDIAEVLGEIEAVRDRMTALLDAGETPLPETPDLERISAWSVSAHQRHWAALERGA